MKKGVNSEVYCNTFEINNNYYLQTNSVPNVDEIKLDITAFEGNLNRFLTVYLQLHLLYINYE